MTTLKNMLTHRGVNIAKWFDIAQTALLVMLFVLLPSIGSNELMHGTVSGKMFFFLYTIFIVCVLFFIKFILKFPLLFSFIDLDKVVFLWVIYILCNGLLHGIQVSDRLLEFGGLILLYLFLRHLEISKFETVLAAIILGGIIQGIYGNFQLWGFIPSHHALFKMTGSFFNPGPFAGYLATVFPLIIGGILFKKKYILFIGKRWNQVFVWVGATLVLLALAASGSRAAWLSIIISSLFLLIKKYSICQWVKEFTLIKRSIVLIPVILLVCISFIAILKINSSSAYGRLLVWKVASSMVVEHPILGVGYDQFKTYYMEKQACYFKENSNSLDAMVAGDTNYCFNDFLQHTVENGMIGLLFIIVLLICAFGILNQSFNNELWIAKAGIVSVAVFAMFSYPAQVLPIKACLICYLAYIAILSEKKMVMYLHLKRNFLKPLLTALVIGAIFLIHKISVYNVAWKEWGLAYELVQAKNYVASINESKKARLLLKHNGDFLTFYGKSLTMAGQHKQAAKVLNQAIRYYPNVVAYTALGDSYKNLGQTKEAEQAYLKAWHMNPSRFYPKYLLTKLYDETGQTEKAIATAEELLGKEVKVESTAIYEIQTEMKNILDRNKERR